MKGIEGFRAIGLQLAQPPNTASDALALAERAEAAGFDLVGVGDVGVDSFSMLGAVAARTTRVEIFANVAGWSRSPVATALAASTLGERSGGRAPDRLMGAQEFAQADRTFLYETSLDEPPKSRHRNCEQYQ